MNRIALIAIIAVLALGAFVAYCAVDAQRYDVESLARATPRRTAMMLQREREAAQDGRKFAVDLRPVPYEQISPQLRRAVLVAEDDAFYAHGGLDWNEIQASARKNLEAGHVVRGGSTITQQLAKNVFLGDARTPTRKLTEVFLAFRLERALSKRRIFELYLNLIEWGDGVFGAEAASERLFGVPASALSTRQAVLLAAVIINPRRFSPVTPNHRIARRAQLIASRLYRRGALDEAEYRLAAGLPPLPADSAAADTAHFGVAPAPAAPMAADSSRAPAGTLTAPPDSTTPRSP